MPNFKALVYVDLEQKVCLCYFYISLRKTYEPRGIICPNLIEAHKMMLLDMKAQDLVVSDKKIFYFHVCLYKPM